jgi:hypothetical protein
MQRTSGSASRAVIHTGLPTRWEFECPHGNRHRFLRQGYRLPRYGAILVYIWREPCRHGR